ncbi:NYN domain-containing protein [Gynurincola endophyticus]|uniref:NYN domain-containing protein n=1 Tax=Gynurincola endophyticus TaxID=2479004 RepID=UPI000F8E057A|nr:NYN domain-containing protein [Gynurincola endophyticus]
MANNKFNIAVLIDGDNAQAKLMKEIIEEVSIYGKATIRRVYGDWTSPQLNSWKEIINQYSINPIQKFSYTTGKNSTDSSLIIDAMDILHAGNIEGFCIVSSDSDYTGLAKRIREEGLFVMGIGKRHTPIAFVNSCEIFTFTENLVNEEPGKILTLTVQKDQTKAKSKKSAPKKDKKTTVAPTGQTGKTEKVIVNEKTQEALKLDLSLIDKAFQISVNEDDQAFVSHVGSNLRKIDPAFDPRTYGFKTLTKLFETIDKYIVIKNDVNGLKHPIVKLK